MGDRRQKPVGLWMAVCAAALALSACGPRPTPGAEILLLPTRTLAPEPVRTEPPPSTVAPRATPAPAGPTALIPCAAGLGPFASGSALPTGEGQIVVVGADGNLGLIDPTTARARRITQDAGISLDNQSARAYLFPTFSADGRSLAFVSLDRTRDGFTQTVQVAEARELPPQTRLYATTTDNIPYLDWAPDNRSVAILSISGRGGALRLAGVEGGDSTVVATGSSIYWHWRADAGAIIAHTDGAADTSANARLSLVQRNTARAERIAALPGYFQAPQFSPDGRRMLYVAQFGDAESLTLADADGTPQCGLREVEAAMYFAWSPGGRHVALIDTPNGLGSPAELAVIDLISGRRITVSTSAMSYAWSPNGRHLAIWSLAPDGVVLDSAAVRSAGETPTPAPARPSPTSPKPAPTATAAPAAAQFAVRLEIADVTTGALTRVADTIPSSRFFSQLPFFDQYSRGASPWSPDGRSLAFVSVDEVSDTAWIYLGRADDAGRAEVRRLVEGELAFWSPR